jgi:hypothetical protein
MGSPKEWEKEVYVTTQTRRYDKQRLLSHSLPKEPNWKTQSRVLDLADRVAALGGIREIESKLRRLEKLEKEMR